MSYAAREFWLVCIFLFAVSGCVDENVDTETSNESGVTTATQHHHLSSEYTPLTAHERAEATQQPWEKPGMQHLKPPQQVLDSQLSSGNTPHEVSPAALQRVQDFKTAWHAEQQKLQSQGVSDNEIQRQRGQFKANFFASPKE